MRYYLIRLRVDRDVIPRTVLQGGWIGPIRRESSEKPKAHVIYFAGKTIKLHNNANGYYYYIIRVYYIINTPACVCKTDLTQMAVIGGRFCLK